MEVQNLSYAFISKPANEKMFYFSANFARGITLNGNEEVIIRFWLSTRNEQKGALEIRYRMLYSPWIIR